MITGYISDSRAGGGVEGVRVETSDSFSVTGTGGYYSLYSSEGVYDIVATKPGRALAVAQDVSITAVGENRVDLILPELFDLTAPTQTLSINVSGLQPDQVISSPVPVTVSVNSINPVSRVEIRVGHLDPLNPDSSTDTGTIYLMLDPAQWGNGSSFLNISAYDIQYNYAECTIPFTFAASAPPAVLDTATAPLVSLEARTYSKSKNLPLSSEIVPFPEDCTYMVEISWDPITGADGYKIYRSIDGQSILPIADMPGDSTEMGDSDPALSPGIPISYVVQAYDSTGNMGLASNSVEVYLLEPFEATLISPANNTSGTTTPLFKWDHTEVGLPGLQTEYQFYLAASTTLHLEKGVINMNRRTILYLGFIVTLAAFAAGCGSTDPVSSNNPTVGGPISGYVDLAIPQTDAELAPHEPGEVIVRTHDAGGLQVIAAELGATTVRSFPSLDAALFKLPDNLNITDALRKLKDHADVIYSHPNYLYRQTALPDDPDFSNGQQWGPQKINAPAAWDLATGDSNVVIAVIDSGVDSLHPDLSGKVILPGYNATSYPGPATTDFYGHGTHVAGIAAGKGNDGTGIAGIAWNSPVLPIRVTNNTGSATVSDILDGILYVVNTYLPEHPGQRVVIYLGVGENWFSGALVDGVNRALDANIPIVAGMGNDGCTRFNSPAVIQGVIAVGAIDPNNRVTDFSTCGDHISVVAPGIQIYSSLPGSTYGRRDGTSMAAAHVTGAIALLLSVDPTLTPAEIKWLLESTAIHPDGPGSFDSSHGYGLIDVAAALDSLPTVKSTYGKVFITLGPDYVRGEVLLMQNGVGIASAITDNLGEAAFHFVPEGSGYKVAAWLTPTTDPTAKELYDSLTEFSVTAGEEKRIYLQRVQ